jgi:iron complex transport system permease protein
MRIAPADLAALAMERIDGKTAGVDAATRTVVEQIRLPRVVLGALIGAALAISGAAMQGLFRNPLADPGLIGISAGAAFGAVGIIVLGHHILPLLPGWAAPFLLSASAFAGCLAATLLMTRLSMHDGHPVVATMLLAGVAINALAGAMTAFVVFLANDQQVRDVTFWLLGSLGGATWQKVLIVAPCVALGLALLPLVSRSLNALLLGESEAGHLGFNVKRTKWIAITLSTLMVGTAVAFAGVISFVGLIVPHAVRLVAGPDHRFLMPASAVLGATLMVAADLLARCVVAPAELPIGILTAIIGAPFFLWVLLRTKAAWQP